MIQAIKSEDGEIIQTLQVPYISQTDSDYLCLVYSIWMVINYYKNVYERPSIRDIVPSINRDQIIAVTKSEYGLGTIISQQLIEDLNKNFPTMEFQLRKNSSFIEIEKSLKKFIPVIVIYSLTFILNNEDGPGHAGVVIGMNKNKIVLNNPWLGWASPLDIISFERAWEIEQYQSLYILPKQQKEIVR